MLRQSVLFGTSFFFLEEIKAIEQKAAKSFNNMFKAMGDKQAGFLLLDVF